MNPEDKASKGKQSGRTRVVLVGILVVALIGILGWVVWQNVVQKPLDDAAKSSKESKETKVAVPDGWKNYQSKKYGISFVAPEDWLIIEEDTEPTSANPAARYAIWIMEAGKTEHTPMGEMTSFAVYEADLDNIAAQIERSVAAAKSTSTTSSLTVNGHEARRITAKVDVSKYPQNLQYLATQSLLLVKAGDFAYNVPDGENTPRAVADGKIKKEDWKTFTESIRIAK